MNIKETIDLLENGPNAKLPEALDVLIKHIDEMIVSNSWDVSDLVRLRRELSADRSALRRETGHFLSNLLTSVMKGFGVTDDLVSTNLDYKAGLAIAGLRNKHRLDSIRSIVSGPR